MGGLVSITLRITNLTNNDITSISVYDIDDFDFGSDLRPDKVFNGAKITSGGYLERKFHIKSIASNCPLAMKMYFRNGDVDVFKINSKCAYDGTNANFRHLTKSHCIIYEKIGDCFLEIIVTNTPEQMDNDRAIQLNREGCCLMAAGKYQEASIKFLEASQKVNEDATKSTIQKNLQCLESARKIEREENAKSLNEEGLKLLKDNKFQQAVNKFQQALASTNNDEMMSSIECNLVTAQEAKYHQDAKMLNQAAMLLRKTNRIEDALKKFDEALEVATEKAMIGSIKRNKAETINQEAKACLEEAWSIGMSTINEDSEAIQKFAKAKSLFEQANTVKASPEYQKKIEIVNIKIEGHKSFYFGLNLENEGSRLMDKPSMAKAKLKAAKKNYERARIKFQEGLKKGEVKFQFGLDITNEALTRIGYILNEL